LHKWIDDFSYSRNKCITKCSGKWILFIDSDEILEVKNKDSFLKEIQNSEFQAFTIIRQEQYRLKTDNKKVSIPVGIVRLIRNNSNIFYSGSVHERVEISLIKNELKIGIITSCQLIHNITSYSKQEIEEKQKYYLRLINNEILNEKDIHWQYFQRAKTNLFFENYKEVLEDINYLLNLKQIEPKIRLAAITLKAIAYTKTDKLDEAVLVLKNVIKTHGGTVFHVLFGDLYFKRGSYHLALIQYIKINTSVKRLNTKNCLYLISFLNFNDKLYKLTSTLYSLKLIYITRILLLFHYKHLKADTYYLLSLTYLRSGNMSKFKFFLEKSIESDPKWLTPKQKLKYYFT
jgi:tetratricopeptide (TPR) repeat protein